MALVASLLAAVAGLGGLLVLAVVGPWLFRYPEDLGRGLREGVAWRFSPRGMRGIRYVEDNASVIRVVAMGALASGSVTDEELWAVYDAADRLIDDSKVGWDAIERLKASGLQFADRDILARELEATSASLPEIRREEAYAMLAILARQGSGFPEPGDYRRNPGIDPKALVDTAAEALGIDEHRRAEIDEFIIPAPKLDLRQLPSIRRGRR